MPDTQPVTPATLDRLKDAKRSLFPFVRGDTCTMDVQSRAIKLNMALARVIEDTALTEAQALDTLTRYQAAVDAGALGVPTKSAKPSPVDTPMVRHPTLGWVPADGSGDGQ